MNAAQAGSGGEETHVRPGVQAESVVVRIPPTFRSALERKLSLEASRFRSQLGLPTDRPVILSGHQGGFWHAGILSKHLAIQSIAARHQAAAAWVTVDHDTPDPFAVAFPVVKPRLARVRMNLAGPGAPQRDVPLCRRPALTSPVMQAPLMATGDVEAGLRDMTGVLARHAGAVSAATQVQRSLQDLMASRSMMRVPVGQFMSSALAHTDVFGDVVERMRADPVRCARLYNEAVLRKAPGRIRPLRIVDDHTSELPLWRIPAEDMAHREPVDSRTIGEHEQSELAPRALLMTAMLRMAGCESFIHGVGGGGESDGGGYDAVTDDWIGAWLGRDLAPVITVTATVYLDLGEAIPSPSHIAGLAWQAHHARHHPGLVGDEGAQARRDELVRQIGQAAGGERLRLYEELHRILAGARSLHAADLELAHERVAKKMAGAAILADRTWPFVFHHVESLKTLASVIETKVAGARV